MTDTFTPTATSARDVETLKGDGCFFAAGAVASALNLPRSYGCHYGMRSTVHAAREAFFRGYDAATVHAAREAFFRGYDAARGGAR